MRIDILEVNASPLHVVFNYLEMLVSYISKIFHWKNHKKNLECMKAFMTLQAIVDKRRHFQKHDN